MKRMVYFLILMAVAIGVNAQVNKDKTQRPQTSVQGGITTIPLIIRGGSHPGSQVPEGEARFVRNVVMVPENPHFIQIPFDLSTLSTALNADKDELYNTLKSWLFTLPEVEMPYDDEMIYCLTDNGSAVYSGGYRGSYWLDCDGRVVEAPKEEWVYDDVDTLVSERTAHLASEYPEGVLSYVFEFDSLRTGLILRVSSELGSLKEGDVCHAEFALRYNDKVVTFDVTVNALSDSRGENISLSTLEKVGEQTLSEQFGLIEGPYYKSIALDADAVCKLFDGNVTLGSLDMYVMTDYAKSLLTDYFSYHDMWVKLDLEGLETVDTKLGQYYSLNYNLNTGSVDIYYTPYAFSGGERASGSVFLVSGNQYYELVLDFTFGDVNDNRTDFEVIDTETLDVKLMPTGTFYTYMTPGDSLSYSLVSTRLDMLRIAQTLGTETPVLFAERYNEETAGVEFTRNYTAGPGQGFWFSDVDGNCLVSRMSDECLAGVYYSGGELRWYEMPDQPKVGDTHKLRLYLVNMTKGTAVCLDVNVEYVETIADVVSHVVRRLPISMNAVNDATGIYAVDGHAPASCHGGSGIYNLSGQRLIAPQRGLNIIDGKKVIVK